MALFQTAYYDSLASYSGQEIIASLFFDEASEHFYVRFRYGGRSLKRSLATSNEKLAQARARGLRKPRPKHVHTI
jgi:hypothetical protein